MATLLAFTPDQVCRLTTLSRRQLRYWDETAFFRPAFSDHARARFNRMYSFKDVVGLRTIAKLRSRLPLQELRRLGAWFRDRYDEPWSGLRFFVIGRNVVFEDPEGHRGLAGSSQTVMAIDLKEMEIETRAITEELLLRRTPHQLGKIVRMRYVQHNSWCLDGTRIPTSAVWDLFCAGLNAQQIRSEYPRLTIKDIDAAIDFERGRLQVG